MIYAKLDYFIATCEANLGVFRVVYDPPQHPGLRQQISTAFEYWDGELSAEIPTTRFGRKLSGKDRLMMASIIGGALDAAIKNTYLQPSAGVPRTRHKFVEMLALTRFNAVYGSDPDPLSIKMAQGIRI